MEERQMKPIGFLKDANGNWSSKRLFATLSFIAAVALAFVTKDATLTGLFMGAATSVFIAQAVSKT